jgi:lysylphosphatidylglycerol synthetase-like protein (DUF2156 family)
MRLASLFRTYKPLTFFGGLGLIFALSSILAGILPVLDYVRDSYVRHVPLAVLAASLMILSSICATLGLILNTLNNRLRELERITILHSTETPGRPAADKD